MKVFCNNCKHLFNVEPQQIGRIQYSKCKSVFRIERTLRSPCPQCKSILKLVENEKHQLIGYPVEAPVTKKTASVSTTRKHDIEKTIREKQTSPHAEKKPQTVEERVRQKLQNNLEGYQRYSVQSFKKPVQKKVIIPDLNKIIRHASKPKVYLSVLMLLCLVLVVGIMKSIFQPDQTYTSQNQIASEEKIEEYEPMHHDEPMGGPAYPSETDRKTGLEDETIKKINSNLQILHLPPLKQVTSTYGIRLDPFTKKLAFHAGIDFKADVGTKIEAAMDGIVKYVGPKSMYGTAVILKHPNGYETLYGHLSKTFVLQGQKIKQKDVIAWAGSSGRSTGPHLHFELIKNGKKIDPLQADLLHIKK